MTSPSPPRRIAIQGEFNIFYAAAVHLQLLDALAHHDEIDVDLSAVSEMDSAGIQLMVAARREAAKRNKTLSFSGHSPAVSDILKLCDLVGPLGAAPLVDCAPKTQP